MNRGFTLMELCIVTLVASAVIGTSTGLVLSLHRSEQRTAAYTREVSELRRAVRSIERDLRAGNPAEYRLENNDLFRGDALLARRIASFEVVREGALSTARVELMPRAGGRRPVVIVRVRERTR
ncbi:MAG: PulJ/GspJ family protein [Planctomycetota bacterium]|jgi:type II secretory pathway component PulJ